MKNKLMAVAVAVIAFNAALLFFAFIAWCGGFDFNARNPDVGFGVFMATALSLVTAAAKMREICEDEAEKESH